MNYTIKEVEYKDAMELPKFENRCFYGEELSNFTIKKGEFDYEKDLTF
ncbi:hypothetical protein vBBceHLY2_00047 [Bacillus phage vB_BceH_LY2]|nr:hypothetical protein vBBceHLY2_00047 [Bacillus phage vB_BceH_LY2]